MSTIQKEPCELDFKDLIETNSILQDKSFCLNKDTLLNWCLEETSDQESFWNDIDQSLTISPFSFSSSEFSTPQSNCPSAYTPEISALPDDIFPIVSNPLSPMDHYFEALECEFGSTQDATSIRHEPCLQQTNRSSSCPTQLVADAFAAIHCSVPNQQFTESAKDKDAYLTDPKFKKISHNAIERRYRNNINERIRELKNAVPALYMAKANKKNTHDSSDSDDDDDDDDDDNDSMNEKHKNREEIGEIIDGVEIARKLNKATILQKATEYIHHLRRAVALAEQESQILQYVLTQMPEGANVLSSFHQQKLKLQQAEHERWLFERRVAIQREKMMRERILRERAAERASVARLLPKRERRPYHRRTKQEIEEQKLAKKKSKKLN